MSARILITGGAGFIGYHLSRTLLERGEHVTGFDNLNDYYDPKLKEARLKELAAFPAYRFVRGELADAAAVEQAFTETQPDYVYHLGAQAGVRYSLLNPAAYVSSNIVGSFNVLEAARKLPPKHLIYASSSSVYGDSTPLPFSVEANVDKPVSLYAASKKADELMAYTYAKLYGLAATGLRFFTVYGPFGRPDMAYFSFTKKILAGETIELFNNGELQRDFTYVDDIVAGLVALKEKAPAPDEQGAPHKLYNLGNSKPVKLGDFVAALERALGQTADKRYVPMQAGDVHATFADISESTRDFGFAPRVEIDEGLRRFVEWYRNYYK